MGECQGIIEGEVLSKNLINKVLSAVEQPPVPKHYPR